MATEREGKAFKHGSDMEPYPHLCSADFFSETFSNIFREELKQNKNSHTPVSLEEDASTESIVLQGLTSYLPSDQEMIMQEKKNTIGIVSMSRLATC